MQHFHLLVIFVPGLLIRFPAIRTETLLYSMLLTLLAYGACQTSNLHTQNVGNVRFVVHIDLVYNLQRKREIYIHIGK